MPQGCYRDVTRQVSGVLHIVMDTEKPDCVYYYAFGMLVLALGRLDYVPFFHFCCPCLHLFPFLMCIIESDWTPCFSPLKSILHTVTSFLLLKPKPICATLCCFNAPVAPCHLQDNVQSLHGIWALSNLLTACFSHHTLRLSHTRLFTVPEFTFINPWLFSKKKKKIPQPEILYDVHTSDMNWNPFPFCSISRFSS